MAGVERIEHSLIVLETTALPLNYTPIIFEAQSRYISTRQCLKTINYFALFTQYRLVTPKLFQLEALVRFELTIKVLQTSSLTTWIQCHVHNIQTKRPKTEYYAVLLNIFARLKLCRAFEW